MTPEHKAAMLAGRRRWQEEMNTARSRASDLEAALRVLPAASSSEPGFVISEQSDLTIHAPKFTVDEPLAPGIPSMLPQMSHTALFCGPPGSGKSSLWTAMLTQDKPAIYAGVFSYVHIICPPSSMASMENSPFAGHPRLYNTLDQETLLRLEGEFESASKAKENSLLVLDDCGSDLKNQEVQNLLGRFCRNRRHKRLSIFIVAQTYRDVPLPLRKLLTTAYLFAQRNSAETEAIASELACMPISRFMAAWDFVFNDPRDRHAFMFIHQGQLHKNFSKIEWQGAK